MAKSKEDEKARAVAEPAGPKPGGSRVCDPSDRAGHGLRRFKLRLDGHPSGPRGPRYVLAPDRESAAACYLAAEGEADGGGARVVFTELPD